MNNNINVAVGGPINADYPKVYKTKFLKPGIPFSLQVTEPDTKYVIKHNFDLGDGSITIPEGCLLEFDGGSLSNGTIVGNNTGIQAGLVKIFNTDVTFSGIWNVAEAYPEWFGAKGIESSSIDDVPFFNKAFELAKQANYAGVKITGTYSAISTLDIPIDNRLFSTDNTATIKVGQTIIVRNGCTVEGFRIQSTPTATSLITIMRDNTLHPSAAWEMYTNIRNLYFIGGSITTPGQKVLDGITINTGETTSAQMAFIHISDITYTQHYRYGVHLLGIGWLTTSYIKDSIFDRCDWTIFNEIDNTASSIVVINCMSEGDPDHCIGVCYTWKGAISCDRFDFGDHFNAGSQGQYIDYLFLIGHENGRINAKQVYNAGNSVNGLLSFKPREKGVVPPKTEILDGDMLTNSISPLVNNTTIFTTEKGYADLKPSASYFRANKTVFNDANAHIYTKFLAWIIQQARTETGSNINSFGQYFVIPPNAIYNPDNNPDYNVDHALELYIARDINTLQEHIFKRKDAESTRENWTEVFPLSTICCSDFSDDYQIIRSTVGISTFSFDTSRRLVILKVGSKFVDCLGHTPTSHRGEDLAHAATLLTSVNESYNKGFNYWIDSKQRMLFWNGTEFVTSEGRTYNNLHGSRVSRPTQLKSTDIGYQYFVDDLGRPSFYGGSRFVDADGFTIARKKGTTAQRPTSDLRIADDEGFQYFDTDLGKPIWMKVVNENKTWIDATGTPV